MKRVAIWQEKKSVPLLSGDRSHILQWRMHFLMLVAICESFHGNNIYMYSLVLKIQGGLDFLSAKIIVKVTLTFLLHYSILGKQK